jgi:RNA polymerase sigma-70 factor (ECF subfamily)
MGRRGSDQEHDLVSAARRGESWALTQIWQQYSPAVVGYLRGKGAVEPEDVASEVFLQVFAKIGKFRGDAASLRTFVFSVAHARYVDAVRRQTRRGVDAELDPNSHGGATASAESAVMDELAAQRVESLIDALAPDQRDVLLLRIVADLSLEQTADVLGKSIGAVKSLQHRGLAALRPILGQAVSK